MADRSMPDEGASPVADAGGIPKQALEQIATEVRAAFPAADLELHALGAGGVVAARVADDAVGSREAIGREIDKRLGGMGHKVSVPPLVCSKSEWQALEPLREDRGPDRWVRMVELFRQRVPQPKATRQQLLGQLREDRALIESLNRSDPFAPRWSLQLAAATLHEVLGLLFATIDLPFEDDEDHRAKLAAAFGETAELLEVHRQLAAVARGYQLRGELLGAEELGEAGWRPLLQRASEGIARAERQIIARYTTAEERRRRRRLIWTIGPTSAVALVVLSVVAWISTRPIPPMKDEVKGPRGATAEYFSDREMSKRLLKRGEQGPYLHDLSGRAPVAEAGKRYGVRWTAFWRIGLPGVHSLCLRSQGRARLYFAGELLIDEWDDPKAAPKPNCEKVRLEPGWYPFRVDYYHEDGPALLELTAGIEGSRLVRLVGGRICCRQPAAPPKASRPKASRTTMLEMKAAQMKAAAAKPAGAKPAAARPAGARPAGAKPAAAKPAGAKPGAARPGAARPGAARPAAAKEREE